MRRSNTRKLALAAVLTAFEVAFTYIACVFPTGQLGFLGVASLFGISAVVELGVAAGAVVYVASALLGLIMLPSKTLAILFAIFFGPYPVVKALCEKLGGSGKSGRVAEWAIKLIFFNATLTVAVFALRMTLFNVGDISFGIPAVYLIGNGVFLLFDIAVTRAIIFYMAKIHPKIHKK